MSWLSGWSERQKISIDHMLIDSDLSNFPVKVIVPSTSNLFTVGKSDGSDVRFTASDGKTLLDFEREAHDDTANIAVYHVKIPFVSSTSDTDFYLYYGNTSASDASSPSSVWDSDYKLVMHMDSSLKDSTSNNNDGTRVAGSYGTDAKGCFMDNDVNVTLPSISLGERDYTLEIHTQIDELEDYTEFINNNDWSGATIHTSANGTVYAGTLLSDRIVTSSGMLSEGIEYVLAVVLDSGSGQILYRNGSNVASNSNTPIPSYGTGHIGGPKSKAKTYEVRLSSTARSSAWIKATYNSLADNLVTFGNEESWITVYVTDGVGLTDAIGSMAQRQALVSESAAFIDAISRLAKFTASAADVVSLTDNINKTVTFRSAVTDGMMLSDVQTPMAKLQAALDEGIITQDQAAAVAAFISVVQEKVTLTDSAITRADYSVVTQEGIVLTGTVEAFNTLAEIIQAAVVEAVTFRGTASVTAALQAQIAEQVGFADSAIGINALIGYIAEAFTVTDGVDFNFKFSVECEDAVQFSDTVSRIMRFTAAVSESVTMSGFALTAEIIDGYMFIRIHFSGGPKMEFSIKQPSTTANIKQPQMSGKVKQPSTTGTESKSRK